MMAENEWVLHFGNKARCYTQLKCYPWPRVWIDTAALYTLLGPSRTRSCALVHTVTNSDVLCKAATGWQY